MKKLSDDIRGVVNSLIDGFAAKGHAEFISEFAHELPSRIFLALMDWPLEDAPLFTEATDVVLFGKPGGTPEESDQARIAAGLTVAGYFQKVIEDRRNNPRGDATSTLINTKVELPDGARMLEDQELILMFYLLLMGGLHTVQGSLAWAIMHLVDNPAQRDLIIADPAVIPKAVEEILRIEAAVAAGRRATRDVELGGSASRRRPAAVDALFGEPRPGCICPSRRLRHQPLPQPALVIRRRGAPLSWLTSRPHRVDRRA